MEKDTTQTNGKMLEGTVVSDAMDKTIVVLVERFVKHSKYLKYYKKSSKIKAHDEENRYKVGDKVMIMETIPLSKDKSFKVMYK